MSDTCGAVDQAGHYCARFPGHEPPHRTMIEWEDAPGAQVIDLSDRLVSHEVVDVDPVPVSAPQPPAATPDIQQGAGGAILVDGVWVFPDPLSASLKCIVCGHRNHGSQLCPVTAQMGEWEAPCDCRGA